MNKDENTIFESATEQQENMQQKQANASGWQQVTIGGVSGILMGASAMYVIDAVADEQSVEGKDGEVATTGTNQTTGNGLHVAEVDQNFSFAEAFAAARNEVGPGGVFHWHGGIYNTYTEQEWNSMSAGERSEFAQQVQPEIRPGEEQMGYKRNMVRNDDNGPKKGDDKNDDKKDDDDDGNTPKPPKDDEPEVHFLGVERIETENGQTINVGRVVAGEHEVALIDMDDNMVFDVAISDRNNNGEIDDDEVVDISDQELSVTDFALMSAIQEGSEAPTQPELANQPQQDHIADDMPDYMNDADVQTI